MQRQSVQRLAAAISKSFQNISNQPSEPLKGLAWQQAGISTQATWDAFMPPHKVCHHNVISKLHQSPAAMTDGQADGYL